MLETLASLDQDLLLYINSFHCDALDPVINFLSRNRYVWCPLYLLIIWLMVKKWGWKRGLVFVGMAALAIGLSDFICASVIRPEVQRLRPSNPDNPVSQFVHLYNGYRSTRYTFPSCHGANCFALAVFTSLTLRRRAVTIFMIVWALFMCYTRLYLGVHYPGDLFVGACIGSAIGASLYFAARAINRRWLGLAALIALAAPAMSAQQQETPAGFKPKFEWTVDLRGIFDNRECDARYTHAKTYFITQLSPEIGVSFDNRTHSLWGGVTYTQPIGCEWDGHRVSPTLYYLYQKPTVKFAFGMISRRHLVAELPNYIMSDSANYFQRTIRGAMVALEKDRGYFQAFIDWKGMQSRNRREAFNIIAQGEMRFGGMFTFGGLAMLNHLARRTDAPEWERVVDNFIVNPLVGFNLSRLLSLRLGPITSITRNRYGGGWIAPFGLWADFNLNVWRLSLNNTIYVGNKPLFPLYRQFYSLLNDGEPYYASKFYNRTTIKGNIISYKNMVSLDAALDFHVAQKNFTFYQRLLLRVTI